MCVQSTFKRIACHTLVNVNSKGKQRERSSGRRLFVFLTDWQREKEKWHVSQETLSVQDLKKEELWKSGKKHALSSQLQSKKIARITLHIQPSASLASMRIKTTRGKTRSRREWEKRTSTEWCPCNVFTVLTGGRRGIRDAMKASLSKLL